MQVSDLTIDHIGTRIGLPDVEGTPRGTLIGFGWGSTGDDTGETTMARLDFYGGRSVTVEVSTHIEVDESGDTGS